MIDQDELSNALHAMLTGMPERAENLLLTTDNLDDEQRKVLLDAVSNPPEGLSAVEALGDAMRQQGVDRSLVNEVYRAAFYGSKDWQSLTHDPLFAFFSANRAGHVLDKWVHYFPIYTRHLSPYVNRGASVLEIGVYRGGSMRMWRSFFGPGTKLVGADIDPVAVTAAGSEYDVVIADQSDPDALRRIADLHGPFDVIIDDGGHTMDQQITSIETLFPLLADGGTYLVEDCHTSYWPEYEGGRGRSGTFIEWAKERIDDINGYHQLDAVDPVWTRHVDGMHVYDSVVVFDRKRRFAPFSEQHGGASFVFRDRIHSSIFSELVATRQAAIEDRDRLASSSAQRQESSEDELRVLRGELAVLRPQLREANQELERTRNRLLDSWQHVREMRNTVSWRVTAPLRRLRNR